MTLKSNFKFFSRMGSSIAIALMVCFLTLPSILHGEWMFVQGDSVNLHFAFIQAFDGELSKNSYVVFRWRGEDPQRQGLKEGMSLVKRVGCMPNEQVTVSKENATCELEEFIPIPQQNSKGEALHSNRLSERIPEGSFFAVGDMANSYDSRYFGLIDIKQITHEVMFGF